MRIFLYLFAILLVSCSSINLTEPLPEPKRETIFGDGGITLFDDTKSKGSAPGSSIGVNVFLWRASSWQ